MSYRNAVQIAIGAIGMVHSLVLKSRNRSKNNNHNLVAPLSPFWGFRGLNLYGIQRYISQIMSCRIERTS